jgi:hypothetical protein
MANRRNIGNISRIVRLSPTQRLSPRGGFEYTYRQNLRPLRVKSMNPCGVVPYLLFYEMKKLRVAFIGQKK